ncbi:hypothetical protein Taro_046830 [Colocasia esculenta]|uniref:Uncharacterized protein n=1 Tax=Colocasia esculenta TaxID=4460 RepID=A0A843WR34_COLES|nr:hypothetical protein [Colocasia esculenta]
MRVFLCAWQVVLRLPWLPLQLGAPGSEWYRQGLAVFLDTLTPEESCRPAEGKTTGDSDS